MKMNFGKLLAAGTSLVNGDVSGRYRMRENIRLPQFISPKNPFAADATVAESVSPSIRSESSAVVSAVTTVTAVHKLFAFFARAGGLVQRLALWCLDHNPFSAIGRPRLPAMPRFGRPAVQAELSLDKVQVLRSDLAHADLEVVGDARASNASVHAAWRNLTTRMFGGGAR